MRKGNMFNSYQGPKHTLVSVSKPDQQGAIAPKFKGARIGESIPFATYENKRVCWPDKDTGEWHRMSIVATQTKRVVWDGTAWIPGDKWNATLPKATDHNRMRALQARRDSKLVSYKRR